MEQLEPVRVRIARRYRAELAGKPVPVGVKTAIEKARAKVRRLGKES